MMVSYLSCSTMRASGFTWAPELFDIKKKQLISLLIYHFFNTYAQLYEYSANQRHISSFVKIVNFVRQARAKDQIGLMAVMWQLSKR